MSINYELSMMQRVEGLHAFLVEPMKPLFGTYRDEPPYVFVSEKLDTVEAAAEELGKILKFQEDGSAIIEQWSNIVAKEGYLTQVEKPLMWHMRVSKTKLQFHVPSLSTTSNQ